MLLLIATVIAVPVGILLIIVGHWAAFRFKKGSAKFDFLLMMPGFCLVIAVVVASLVSNLRLAFG